MNTRTVLVIGLALLFGVAAAVAVSQWGGNSSDAAAVEMAPVVVAAVEMPRGMAVAASMLKTSEWPKSKLPAGAIAAIDDAVGRTVVIPLLAGEPVLEQKITKSGLGRGAASLVPHGMRAFTVLTPTLTAGVAGLVLPGNKVDVLWTAANANRTNDDDSGATVTLLQNIEILAADQQMAMPDDKTNKELRSVTLQVTETDAKKLSLAQQNGTLNLALRNSGDLEKIDSPVVTMRDIRYAQGKPPEIEPAVVEEPAAPPQPVRVRIRTLHGRQSGEVRLELYGRAAVPEPPAVVPAPLEAGAGAERLVDSGG